MNDLIEKVKAVFQDLLNQAKGLIAKITGKPVSTNGSVLTTTVKSSYEINLVPEVKMRMIKAQKMRNLVLFICIVVSSVAVGAVVILFGVKSGQDIAIAAQGKKIETMSKKLNSYTELNDLITIQGQLEGIEDITSQKTVLVRVFGALGAMLPQGADYVKFSELIVNMENNLIRLDGQADAKVDPLIDYRVLESFKKGVSLTKYDYGRYYDADGNQLPAYCIEEADEEGNIYHEGDNFYAWWNLTLNGCEGSRLGGQSVPGALYHYSSGAEVEEGIPEKDDTTLICDENGENCFAQGSNDDDDESEDDESSEGDEPEDEETEGEESEEGDEGEQEEEEEKPVPLKVKIWRTPQFNKWYASKNMQLNGSISGIEHFASECYQYSGEEYRDSTGKQQVRWTSLNDCMLVSEGLEVTSSSNGRDENDSLVLKFSGQMVFAKEFFSFRNKHMIAIGPLGQNVTDSYLQIGNMFTKEAEECAPDDTECLTDKTNRGEKN